MSRNISPTDSIGFDDGVVHLQKFQKTMDFGPHIGRSCGKISDVKKNGTLKSPPWSRPSRLWFLVLKFQPILGAWEWSVPGKRTSGLLGQNILVFYGFFPIHPSGMGMINDDWSRNLWITYIYIYTYIYLSIYIYISIYIYQKSPAESSSQKYPRNHDFSWRINCRM